MQYGKDESECIDWKIDAEDHIIDDPLQNVIPESVEFNDVDFDDETNSLNHFF